MSAVFSCFKCGEAVPLSSGQRIGLRDTCPKCDADLHSCMNCRHYDRSVHNQCRETQAEWVRYKDAANKCDWFQPLVAEARSGQRPATSGSDAARKKFDDLFK